MKNSKSRINRPYVILSAAMSLNGYISSLGGDSELSNPQDWQRVHNLRMNSDAIMVGSETIKIDNSKLTVKEEYVKNPILHHPIRIVVSSRGDIPVNSRVITFKPEIKTIIGTTSQCSEQKQQELENLGCVVILCGDGPLVDLEMLLKVLKKDFKINMLMLEGGGTLNAQMLKLKFIDEIQLTIAPVICGSGTNLFNDKDLFPTFEDSPLFCFENVNRLGDMIYTRIVLQYSPRIHFNV